MKNIDVDRISAELIAAHPGLRLSSTGSAVPERWVMGLLLCCTLPGILLIFPLPATMLNPNGLGVWITVTRLISGALALLVAWLLLGLFRAWANPDAKSPNFLGILLLVAFFAPMIFGLSQATFLRVIPLLSTYVSASPQTITRDYRFIKYNRPCRRKCLFEKMTDTAGPSYSLSLPDYPDFVAPITLYEKPVGFFIQYSSGSWPRELPSLLISGPANWFGMRVKTLTPIQAQEL